MSDKNSLSLQSAAISNFNGTTHFAYLQQLYRAALKRLKNEGKHAKVFKCL